MISTRIAQPTAYRMMIAISGKETLTMRPGTLFLAMMLAAPRLAAGR